MAKRITLPTVSFLKNRPVEVEKINPAEMSTPKRRRRGAKRKAHDPQAALLAARKKMFGTVAPAHEDATEQRKDRAIEGGGMALVDGQRVRRIADPLETLYRKSLLAPNVESDGKENSLNAVLYHAGTRYREVWRGAGLDGIAAQDLTHVVVDGGTDHENSSDYAADCWKKVREVAEAVGPRLLPYLNGLVIDEKSVAKLAGAVTDTKSQRLAEVIAVERVRESLHRAAGVFRLQPDDRVRPILAGTDSLVIREARPNRSAFKPMAAGRSSVTAGIGRAALGLAVEARGQGAVDVVRSGFGQIGASLCELNG